MPPRRVVIIASRARCRSSRIVNYLSSDFVPSPAGRTSDWRPRWRGLKISFPDRCEQPQRARRSEVDGQRGLADRRMSGQVKKGLRAHIGECRRQAARGWGPESGGTQPPRRCQLDGGGQDPGPRWLRPGRRHRSGRRVPEGQRSRMRAAAGWFRHVTNRLLRAPPGALSRALGPARENAPGRCRTVVVHAHVRPPAALRAAAIKDSRAHAPAGINRYGQLAMVQRGFLVRDRLANGP